MKRIAVLALLAFVLMTFVGYAAVKEVPMNGAGAGVITGAVPGPNGVEISAVGEGTATHLGKFTREESIVLNPATGAVAGTMTFTAADGSELYCEFAGAFTGPATAAGIYTFTGGTGRFENTTGEAYFNITQSDEINFTFEFAGAIDLK